MKGKIVNDAIAVQEELERKHKELGSKEFFRRVDSMGLLNEKSTASSPEKRATLLGEDAIASIQARHPSATREDILDMAEAFGF